MKGERGELGVSRCVQGLTYLLSQLPCSPSGKASALRTADLGSIPALAADLFPGQPARRLAL